jgi:hypothetical protein
LRFSDQLQPHPESAHCIFKTIYMFFNNRSVGMPAKCRRCEGGKPGSMTRILPTMKNPSPGRPGCPILILAVQPLKATFALCPHGRQMTSRSLQV